MQPLYMFLFRKHCGNPPQDTIHDIDEDNGRHFIVMELLEGETLKRHIDGKPMSIEQVLVQMLGWFREEAA
ncbi:MAG TPA: hypothetical protein VG498_02850 [Terriglobales bacterium]|nr:hypothetical protein [Terriglobales bacterium]